MRPSRSWTTLATAYRRTIMRAIACLVAWASACAHPTSDRAGGADHARANPTSPTYALVNGRWWRGDRFEPRTFYVERGLLRARRPARVDSTIDLAGRYVVPPFGDAHSHNLHFERAPMDSVRAAYLREGTFYVQLLGNSAARLRGVRDRFYDRPCAIDVTAAHGILTSTDGHGTEVSEAIALGYADPWNAIYDQRADTVRRSRLVENDRYWLLDSVADVEAKWPRILAERPDLIKVVVIGMPDDSGRAPSWPARMYFMHGLSEPVLRAVVARAHAAGLRVAAHIETARDFAVSVRDGVDIVAHMLGPDFRPSEERAYRIADADAALAAVRGVVVIPTVAITNDVVKDSVWRAHVHDVQRANLRTLARHGVTLAVGRDEVWHTAREEFDALAALGAFDAPTLLRMWAEATPRSIFPGRRIGRLEDGYEASLLALRDDPSRDPRAVGTIALRMKQGCLLP